MNPEDRNRNILLGVVFLIVIVLVIIYFVRRNPATNIPTFSPLPTSTSSFQQNLEDNFGITIPTSALKADLKDVTGKNQMGLTTLDKEGTQDVYTVLANLEDPTPGYFYQAWLVKPGTATNNPDIISLGKLSIAKSGWLVTFITSANYRDYTAVWITEEKSLDTTSETHILEGSF